MKMYAKASGTEVEANFLSFFCVSGGRLRIAIIATTAFGMGIDYQDVRKVYHYGPPSCLEQYIQDTGGAECDRLQSQAVLLCGQCGEFISQEVEFYGENKTICRHVLFQNFVCHQHEYIEPPYMRSDVSAVVCEFARCKIY